MKRIAIAIVFIIMFLVILITTTTLISLQDEVVNLQNQIVGLEEYVEDLEDLRSKINFMINPRIVTKLGVSDVRTDPYRLYIDGFVSNCGYEPKKFDATWWLSSPFNIAKYFNKRGTRELPSERLTKSTRRQK